MGRLRHGFLLRDGSDQILWTLGADRRYPARLSASRTKSDLSGTLAHTRCPTTDVSAEVPLAVRQPNSSQCETVSG